MGRYWFPILATCSSREHKRRRCQAPALALPFEFTRSILTFGYRLNMRNPMFQSKRINEEISALSTAPSSLDEKERVGYPSPLDQHFDDVDPKEEMAFVWRLDLWFLTIGFLGYMFKYIDQTNINNAYVSGMKEDLNLHGNELNYFTTYFNVCLALGYLVLAVDKLLHELNTNSYVLPCTYTDDLDATDRIYGHAISIMHSNLSFRAEYLAASL